MMKLFCLVILCSIICGCSQFISGRVSTSIDPSFVPTTNMRVVVVPQEFDSIYYLPMLKESLNLRGFNNVKISNSKNISPNSYDLKIALGVERKLTETTETVNDYGIVGTKIIPGDRRCTTTNNELLGRRLICRTDATEIENIYGYTGEKEEKTTTLTRSIDLEFINPSNGQKYARAIGSSEETDYYCSNAGIFKFLIIHTIKRISFTKPINYDYTVELPEGYGCETVDEYERSIRDVIPNSKNISNTKSHVSQSKNSGYTLKTGCIEGDCIGGLGTYVLSNGEKYIGQFKDRKFHGEGKYTFPDGQKYIGKFKDGQRNGYGAFTYLNGHNYVGHFKDNKRDGHGMYSFPNGEKKVGQWKNDKLLKQKDRLPSVSEESIIYEIPELGISARDYNEEMPVIIYSENQPGLHSGGVTVLSVKEGGRAYKLGIRKDYRIVSYTNKGLAVNSVPLINAKELKDLAKDKGSKFFTNFVVVKPESEKNKHSADWSRLCLLLCM